MKHGSPTEADLVRLADGQETKEEILLDDKCKRILAEHLKRHIEDPHVILSRREIEYLIQLLEKGK